MLRILECLAGIGLIGVLSAPCAGWADGSVAYAPNGRAGISVDARGRRAADELALRYCAQDDCRIVGHFENMCASIATGRRGGYGWATRDRRERADRAAMERCDNEGARGCEVAVHGCDGN